MLDRARRFANGGSARRIMRKLARRKLARKRWQAGAWLNCRRAFACSALDVLAEKCACPPEFSRLPESIE